MNTQANKTNRYKGRRKALEMEATGDWCKPAKEVAVSYTNTLCILGVSGQIIASL